ncbi:MAG TPA: hypothetical protein VEA59_05770 [Patescibacteria group bacterium]|nr:hypothetical protein [Patescibacteria group bacterium]
MDDIKTQAIETINESPLSEEVKAGLLQKLEEEGVSEEFFVELKAAALEAQATLNEANKDVVAEVRKIDDEEDAEHAKVFAQYEKEMDELEADANSLVKAMEDAEEKHNLDTERAKIAAS